MPEMYPVRELRADRNSIKEMSFSICLATLIALLNIAYAFLKSRMFIALMFL